MDKKEAPEEIIDGDQNQLQQKQISGIAVVYLIALGLLIIISLVLFAKRQIVRFAYATRKEIHAPVASGAGKDFVREVKRRICESRQIHDLIEPDQAARPIPEGSEHEFRIRAVQLVSRLDALLSKHGCPIRRNPRLPFGDFLRRLRDLILDDVEAVLIARLDGLHGWASHHPSAFTETQFKEFQAGMVKVSEAVESHRAGFPKLTAQLRAESLGSRVDGLTGTLDPGVFYQYTPPPLETSITEKKGPAHSLPNVFRNRRRQRLDEETVV